MNCHKIGGKKRMNKKLKNLEATTVIANRKKEREAKKIKLNMKCTGGEKHE